MTSKLKLKAILYSYEDIFVNWFGLVWKYFSRYKDINLFSNFYMLFVQSTVFDNLQFRAYSHAVGMYVIFVGWVC